MPNPLAHNLDRSLGRPVAPAGATIWWRTPASMGTTYGPIEEVAEGIGQGQPLELAPPSWEMGAFEKLKARRTRIRRRRQERRTRRRERRQDRRERRQARRVGYGGSGPLGLGEDFLAAMLTPASADGPAPTAAGPNVGVIIGLSVVAIAALGVVAFMVAPPKKATKPKASSSSTTPSTPTP